MCEGLDGRKRFDRDSKRSPPSVADVLGFSIPAEGL